MSIFLFKESGGIFLVLFFFFTMDFTKEFSNCSLFDFDLTFCYFLDTSIEAFLSDFKCTVVAEMFCTN